jgi:hypothetical protein
LLLEHTYNLLNTNAESTSSIFIDWENSKSTLFSKPDSNPLDDCLSLLKEACSTEQKGDEMMEAINSELYSQAFRKACAYGAVEVINLLLEHKSLLKNFDINEKSSNGNTALDWVKKSTIDDKVKVSLVEQFIKLGAVTGKQVKLGI